MTPSRTGTESQSQTGDPGLRPSDRCTLPTPGLEVGVQDEPAGRAPMRDEVDDDRTGPRNSVAVKNNGLGPTFARRDPRRVLSRSPDLWPSAKVPRVSSS